MESRQYINIFSVFAILVDRYVTAIKHGAIPDVDGAFSAVAKAENAKIEEEAVAMFEREMIAKSLPVPETVLRKSYTEEQDKALNYLRKNVVHDKTFEHEHQAKVRDIERLIWTLLILILFFSLVNLIFFV